MERTAIAHKTETMAPLPATLFVLDSEVKMQDVLLGKGGPSAFHVGTVAMKAVIEARLAMYINSNLLVKGGKTLVKTLITLQVVNSVQLVGGRFLEKISQVGNPDQWYVMANFEARIKVRELFREFIKNQTTRQRLPCALLDKIGLSGLFNQNSTYIEIVLHVANSPDIQDFLGTRNSMREKREERRFWAGNSIAKQDGDDGGTPLTLPLTEHFLAASKKKEHLSRKERMCSFAHSALHTLHTASVAGPTDIHLHQAKRESTQQTASNEISECNETQVYPNNAAYQHLDGITAFVAWMQTTELEAP